MRLKALTATLIACAIAAPAFAWNPLVTTSSGALRWPTAGPVVWNPDGGPLGMDSNATAVGKVATAFGTWNAVSTSVIVHAQGVQIVDPGSGLPTDVTLANYSAVIAAANGQNPIIFDNNRQIYDALGTASGVVGFAGILTTSGLTVTKGYAVLQGDWFDGEPMGTPPSDPGEVSLVEFNGMMVHEFGHYSGLGHTSVNHEVVALPGCPAPTDADLETMGPVLHSGSTTLHNDDIVGISYLYPTAGFSSSLSTIRGTLVDRDGATGFDGGNMVLRPDTTVCADLYNLAQAALSGANPGETGGAGSYSFPGLAPGGGYRLLATTINDGYSYPITPAATLGGPDEFYNGANEDWFNPPDDPAAVTTVTTGAGGSLLTGIDIRINNPGNPGEVPDTAPDALIVTPFDGNTPLPPVVKAIDDGTAESATGYLGTAQTAWITRITPGPTEYPFTIDRVDVLFVATGTIAVGRPIRILVYTDPAGTGIPSASSLVYTQDETIMVIDNVTFSQYTLTTPVTVTSGDFYVGAYDLLADAGDTFPASIDTTTVSNRSWQQANSTAPATYGLAGGGLTFMVRAHGSTLPTKESVMLSWGDACNIGTVPGQDYAVYEGSLTSLPGSADHAPIACSTGGATMLDVIEPGGGRFWLVAPVLASHEGSLGTGTGGSPRTPVSTCEAVVADACP